MIRAWAAAGGATELDDYRHAAAQQAGQWWVLWSRVAGVVGALAGGGAAHRAFNVVKGGHGGSILNAALHPARLGAPGPRATLLQEQATPGVRGAFVQNDQLTRKKKLDGTAVELATSSFGPGITGRRLELHVLRSMQISYRCPQAEKDANWLAPYFTAFGLQLLSVTRHDFGR